MEELGSTENRVSGIPECYKFCLGDAAMLVRPALFADRANTELLAADRIVVADKQSGRFRQSHQALHRRIQRFRVSSWEVTAGRSNIGLEDGIPCKYRLANHISNMIRCVTGKMEYSAFESAELELLIVVEQEIESVVECRRFKSIYWGERFLNYRYSFADSDGCVEFLLVILGSRQVVGVSVGFENVFNSQALFLDERQDVVCSCRRNSSRWRIIIEDGINESSVPCDWIRDYILPCRGTALEERKDSRRVAGLARVAL